MSTEDEATRAERKLAAMIQLQLELHIEPYDLRRFVKDNWQTIAPRANGALATILTAAAPR